MARKTPVQPTEVLALDTDAVNAANAALTLQGQQATRLMSAYNVTHANPDALEAEIRGYQTTAVEAMFAIGARLLVMRTVVEHGDWIKRLERLNMAPRAAQRVMQATLKFADPSKPRDKLLGLGKGKLIELLTLDDEELDVLSGGGDVLELDLDDVAGMSTTELRKHLREARADAEAKDRLIEKRGKEIDKLHTQLERKFVPEPGSVAETETEQAQYLALQEAHTEALAVLARLTVVVRDIKAAPSVSEAMEMAADNAIRHACQRLVDIVNDNGLAIDLEELVTPAWLQAPDEAATQSKARGKRS
ncbi:MAG: hypothetical protein AB7I35_12145 [Ramlibacter sp.]